MPRFVGRTPLSIRSRSRCMSASRRRSRARLRVVDDVSRGSVRRAREMARLRSASAIAKADDLTSALERIYDRPPGSSGTRFESHTALRDYFDVSMEVFCEAAAHNRRSGGFPWFAHRPRNLPGGFLPRPRGRLRSVASLRARLSSRDEDCGRGPSSSISSGDHGLSRIS